MQRKEIKTYVITVMLMISLLLIGMASVEKYSKLTYSMVDTPIDRGFKELKLAEKTQTPVTIVLRRTGCEFCQKDQKAIVSNVEAGRLSGQKILVLDTAKMNKKQIDYIKHNFPKILYRKKYIATPTVFVAQYQKNWKTTIVENTGDVNRIKQILTL